MNICQLHLLSRESNHRYTPTDATQIQKRELEKGIFIEYIKHKKQHSQNDIKYCKKKQHPPHNA